MLRGLPFQDYDRILTAFSPHAGLMTLIIKGANKPQSVAFPINLLTRAEFVYTKSKSDMFKCVEAHIIDLHLCVREHLVRMEAACDMAQAVLHTQMPQAASPALYDLMVRYLKHIDQIGDPHVLAASFRLKVLRHEGLFDMQQDNGAFHEDEFMTVAQLAHCRTFAQLSEIALTADLKGKIDTFFKAKVSH